MGIASILLMKRRLFVIKYHGNNRATFGCPQGHVWDSYLIKPKDLKGRGIGETGLNRLASWWTQERGGFTGVCLQCKRSNDEKRS
jgi:hypothetical protein